MTQEQARDNWLAEQLQGILTILADCVYEQTIRTGHSGTEWGASQFKRISKIEEELNKLKR
jgi:hypothetical protein